MNQFIGYDNIVPVLTNADITSNDTYTAYVDLKGVNRAAFFLAIGNIHSGTAGDTETITVEAATDPAGTEAAIAFKYRLSGAAGTNTWTAITAATTSGYTYSISDDGKNAWIEVDPDALAASDYRYVRVKIAPTSASQMANFVVGVYAFLDTKYKMTTYISATASASA